MGLRAAVLAVLVVPSMALAQTPPERGAAYRTPENNPNGNAAATTLGRGFTHERPPLSLGDRAGMPITYRGDGPNAFRDGFRSKGTNTDLLQHQMEKKPAGTGQSAYVSTSKDPTVARKFVGLRHGGNGTMYDVQASGVDVNATLGTKSIYPGEQEIAVLGGISPYDVRGSWTVKDGKVGPYARNPDYHPAMVNSDAIVARDQYGNLFDKRTGQRLTDAQAADAMTRAGYYAAPSSVTVFEKDAAGATGIDAGPFHDGRATIAEGTLGEVHVDVLRLDGQGQARAGVTADGVAANVFLQGRATLAGIGAQSRTFGLGDPDALTSATAQGSADAFLGADAQLNATAAIGRRGVNASVQAGAFVGGKAEADGTTQVSVCGAQVIAAGHGEVSYGLGAEAAGYFHVDWSTMTVKVGGKAALTAGLGAGAGGEVELSLAKVMGDPRAAGRCVVDGAKDALAGAARGGIALLSRGADALDGAAHAAAKTLCFWCHDDAPAHVPAARVVATRDGAPRGTNVPRNASTRPSAVAAPGVRARDAVGVKR